MLAGARRELHGHAGHSLGVRLSHRRGGGVGRERGGVISPGGVGYDINCGVRLLRTDLTRRRGRAEDQGPGRLRSSWTCPRGVGEQGKAAGGREDAAQPLTAGRGGRCREGMGRAGGHRAHGEPAARCRGADPGLSSSGAMERGQPQTGHAGQRATTSWRCRWWRRCSIERVADALRVDWPGAGDGDDPHRLARASAIRSATTTWRRCSRPAKSTASTLPDPQLACAPLGSPEGQRLPGGDGRGGELRLGQPPGDHALDAGGVRGKSSAAAATRSAAAGLRRRAQHRQVRGARGGGEARGGCCVHRKGADAGLPAGAPRVARRTASVGQPVIVPGDMGRASYVLVGTRARDGGDVGLDLPRRRAADEPPRRRRRQRGATSAKELAEAGVTRGRRAGRGWRRRCRRPTRTWTTWWRCATGPASEGWCGCGPSG